MKKPRKKHKTASKNGKRKSKPVMAAKAAAPVEFSVVPPIARPAPKRRGTADIQRELSEAYKMVFNSLFGQRVKADIFTYCNVYHPIEGNDLYQIGKREGERNVALRIAQMLGLRPEHFETDAWDTSGTIDNMMMA